MVVCYNNEAIHAYDLRGFAEAYLVWTMYVTQSRANLTSPSFFAHMLNVWMASTRLIFDMELALRLPEMRHGIVHLLNHMQHMPKS
jgi:hypothetical protein